MGNRNDFDTLKEVIESIPDEKVLSPSIPVSNYVQEAEDLYKWSVEDIEKLRICGVDEDKLEDLLVRTGACREAQSEWSKELKSQKEAARIWSDKSPDAYDLREELLHTYQFAFRNNEELFTTLNNIREGSGHADMIQDLNDLVVLGNAQQELLQIINFNQSKIEQAAQMADEMAGILADANGEKLKESATRVTRDKSYTYLKELVDEIRACGKFVFWKNENRLKGYRSQFLRRQNLKQRS